ncbi:unnamed protein product, partial [Discosporangium mesarthrocarpum]
MLFFKREIEASESFQSEQSKPHHYKKGLAGTRKVDRRVVKKVCVGGEERPTPKRRRRGRGCSHQVDHVEPQNTGLTEKDQDGDGGGVERRKDEKVMVAEVIEPPDAGRNSGACPPCSPERPTQSTAGKLKTPRSRTPPLSPNKDKGYHSTTATFGSSVPFAITSPSECHRSILPWMRPSDPSLCEEGHTSMLLHGCESLSRSGGGHEGKQEVGTGGEEHVRNADGGLLTERGKVAGEGKADVSTSIGGGPGGDSVNSSLTQGKAGAGVEKMVEVQDGGIKHIGEMGGKHLEHEQDLEVVQMESVGKDEQDHHVSSPSDGVVEKVEGFKESKGMARFFSQPGGGVSLAAEGQAQVQGVYG